MLRLILSEVIFVSHGVCGVLIDPKSGSGSLHLGESRPHEMFGSDEELRDDKVPVNPDGEWARLYPPRILGFSLDQKQMLQFKVGRATRIIERNLKKSFERNCS
jgi:hypothetical protein